MTHHRIPLSTLALYTPGDVADLQRDIAFLAGQLAGETDPAWRAALAAMIRDDEEWLAEMQDALPLMLPIGLPAPGPRGIGA